MVNSKNIVNSNFYDGINIVLNSSKVNNISDHRSSLSKHGVENLPICKNQNSRNEFIGEKVIIQVIKIENLKVYENNTPVKPKTGWIKKVFESFLRESGTALYQTILTVLFFLGCLFLNLFQ